MHAHARQVQRDIEFSLSYGKEHSVDSRAWYPVRSPRIVFIFRMEERKFLTSQAFHGSCLTTITYTHSSNFFVPKVSVQKVDRLSKLDMIF